VNHGTTITDLDRLVEECMAKVSAKELEGFQLAAEELQRTSKSATEFLERMLPRHGVPGGRDTRNVSMTYCHKCHEHRRLIEVMDGALRLSAALAAAIGPLIPHREGLSPDLLDKWQKVVNVICESSEYADMHNLKQWGGKKVGPRLIGEVQR
jgi:hypothetical protein